MGKVHHSAQKLFLKNNGPQRKTVKNLGISLSTEHHIKQFRESQETFVRKGQGQKLIMDGHDLQALRQHYRHNSVVDIAAWAREKNHYL